MAASGDREPNDFRSYLRTPEFRILLGAGVGYVAGRLLNRREDVLRSKLSQLNSAPTIPISSLKTHAIPKEGELVFIENGIVYPLSSLPAANYHSNERREYFGGYEVVVSKTVTSTDQPQEFKDVLDGSSSVDVYRVPFALVAGKIFGRGSFVIVKNTDTDHFVLEHKKTVTAPINPPVKLTKKVVKDENGMEMSSTVMVNKVSKESVLLAGTRLQNVFGRLSKRNGMAEIEPCPNFPKECFTMRRNEIKYMVREEVYGDVYPSRKFGVGFGLVSLGLLFSGFYSHASNIMS